MKSTLNHQLVALKKKIATAETRLKKHYAVLATLPARHGYKNMAAFIEALQHTDVPTPSAQSKRKGKAAGRKSRPVAKPRANPPTTAKKKPVKKKSGAKR